MNVRDGQIGDPNRPDTNAAKAVAYVNHGRWVADCPSSYCGGAMVVSPGHPFLCGNCLNVDCGYQYRLVAWPEERGLIEEALADRPVPEVANWYPSETISGLRAETAARMEGLR